jgi:eukaryotic-like serine/threonine-protein kinase
VATLAAGQLIDARYTLVKRLGAGTFGEVWKARDGKFPKVERFVAIKFLKEEHLANANIVDRFEKEADALAALHHEHVIAVSDRGDWNGGRYMAMELVAGRTLEQWLEEHQEAGRLPDLPAVQRIFDQVCAGVGAAHAVTVPGPIVHRDLKPENVMLRPGDDGPVAKVLDFGIARLGRRSQESRTGFMMGTIVCRCRPLRRRP